MVASPHNASSRGVPTSKARPIALVCLLLAPMLVADMAWGQKRGRGQVPIENLNDPPEEPDYSRLPVFYTSRGGAYDAFVNEYFLRNLSVDETGIYFTAGEIFTPTPGTTGVIEKITWDAWFLPWVDIGAMGLKRQPFGDPDAGVYLEKDMALTGLLQTGMDKYGYTYNRTGNWLEPTHRKTQGNAFMWSWPAYWDNDVCSPPDTGWEFQGSGATPPAWTANDFDFAPNYPDNSLAGTITGSQSWIRTPEFDCDVFHLPLVTIDIKYVTPSGTGSDELLDHFRIYWKREGDIGFSEARSVGIDFAVAPPDDFPSMFVGGVGGASARYSLHFPMYLHPEWRGRITQLMLEPVNGAGAPDVTGTQVFFNYIRATYDLRLPETNSTLINATYRYLMWGDDRRLKKDFDYPQGGSFLEIMLPDLRRAMLFMNEHLEGKTPPHLLDFSWMIGQDGFAGPGTEHTGRGQASGFWDLSPNGRYDLHSSAHYYYSLKAMAEIEELASARGVPPSTAQVIGPDNQTVLTYSETPETLRALAEQVKAGIEQAFWNPETGRFARNIDVYGTLYDYGYVFDNLQALFFGIGTEEQRDSILSWLDGSRTVAGDHAQGPDIYHWRFAPRTTTLHNHSYYPWNWANRSAGTPPDPPPHSDCYDEARFFSFGGKFENGGAVPFTSLFDLAARIRSGDQSQIDAAYARTLEIQSWFEDVRAASGPGNPGNLFYDAYYQGNTQLGCLQGGTRGPGGLGLDREFTSSGAMGSLFLLYGFLGIDAVEDYVLDVAPALPTALDHIGVTNVYYRGNHLTIEAGRVGPGGPAPGDYISFTGSTIPNGAGHQARLRFREVPDVFAVYQDGVAIPDTAFEVDAASRTATVLVDLAATYVFGEHVADLDFSATPATGEHPLPVTFSADVTGEVTRRTWLIGQDPPLVDPPTTFDYTFEQPGTYPVTVRIEGSWGSYSETKYVVVTENGNPVFLPLDLDFSEGLQGWSATGIGPISETPEGVLLPIEDPAPQLHSPLGLSLDGTTYGSLVLRLRVEGEPLTEPA
ncbi:MAG: PKD domain-containing protein, partial [Holophagales bacterium]|nr:PKD domain-containing protein [Holophagales bacterium]